MHQESIVHLKDRGMTDNTDTAFKYARNMSLRYARATYFLFKKTKSSAEHFLQYPPTALATPKAVTRGITICGASCAAIVDPPPIATVVDNA